MYTIKDHRKIGRLIQEGLEVLDSLFFSEVKPEFFLYLFMDIPMFDIRNIGIHHERNQVKDEIGAFAKDGERGKAKMFEPGIMCRSCSAHSVYHFLAHLNRRREGFRVSAQNVAKIN